MFRTIFFSLILCVFTFSATNADRDSDFVEECMKNNSLTEEDFLNYNADENTDKFLCYNKCMSMKNGILNEDGTINPEKFEIVQYKVEKAKLVQFFDCIEKLPPIIKCKDMRKIDACAKIFSW